MSIILKYFDRWNDVVKAAGLEPLGRTGRPDGHKGYTEEELLQMIKEASVKSGEKYLSITDFVKFTGISERPIYRIFGNWNTAIGKAGLTKHPANKSKIPDDYLFKEYLRITNELGRFPNYVEFERRSKYSMGVYEHRFGNFTEFRKHFAQYGNTRGLIKPEISQLKVAEFVTKSARKEKAYEALKDRPILGERIDFRWAIPCTSK